MVSSENESSEGILSGDGRNSTEIPNAAPRPGSTEALEGSVRSIGRYLPEAGERCLIDGALAEIVVFDTAANIFTAEMQQGRSINRLTGHISNTRFTPLEDGRAVITTDGLDRAQAQSSMLADAQQETLDEGLARITASQGNQFTSLDQQTLLSQQPQAGDPQELALEKLAGEVDVDTDTPSDRETVDGNAPAEATNSASESQAKSE